jgi:hypothetical protein
MTSLLVLLVFGMSLVGCGKGKMYDGPTVDAFNGRLTHDGKPASFPPGENVVLQVILHEKGQSFGIPIREDGSFQIGWMPIGKYSAMLIRGPKGPRGGESRYNVPDGFAIADGKTDYTIDLGKRYKP